MSTIARHPRRDDVAREAYRILVTEVAARRRVHAPYWHSLSEPDREKWRDQADAWAAVLMADARDEVARRKAAEQADDERMDRIIADAITPRTVFRAPTVDHDSDWFKRADPALPTGPIYQPSGFVDRSFVDRHTTPRPAYPGSAYGARYVIGADGTVTKTFARPKPIRELEQGHATDTRRTTHHSLDLDPADRSILRRAFAYALTTYPLAAHGLPAGETECGCETPAPMRHYADASPLHPDHRPPADAWLRCVTCRGLYTR